MHVFVCICTACVINRQDEVFVYLIGKTKGCDVHAAYSKLGSMRNQLVLRQTVKILISPCANHHNTILAEK